MANDEFEQWAEERRRRLAERRARRARPPHPGPEAEPARDPGGSGGAQEAEADAGRFGRKEKVLHTRISEALDAALRRASEELRVPVSNLVRNALEDVFTVVGAVAESVEEFVDDIVDEAGDARERIFGTSQRQRHTHHRRRSTTHSSHSEWTAGTAEPGAPDAEDLTPERERADFPDVVGWQSLLLNAAQACADCQEPLPKGARAFLGIPTSGPPKTYLCRDCMRARTDADDASAV